MSTTEQNWCYLNGEYLPRQQARISPLDRGFLFGEGVYEVIPVHGRKPLRLQAHLQRLQGNLDAVGIACASGPAQWAEITHQLIERHPWVEQAIYLHITNGAPALRNHSHTPRPAEATVFATADPIIAHPEYAADGVDACSAPDPRWLHCNWKTTSLLANCLLRNAAVSQGCFEMILLRDGFLTEGAASNVFIVHGQTLLTPPKSKLILPGISRDIVLELAAANGIAHREAAISETRLRSADEIWLSASTRGILPVVRLDANPVGDGRPGAAFKQMTALYQQFVAHA